MEYKNLKGLKIPRGKTRAGSIPAPGTNFIGLAAMILIGGHTLCAYFAASLSHKAILLGTLRGRSLANRLP